MRIFGTYEYYNIEANKLVVLPQVRKIKNTKIDELIDSIQDKGLINQIDVARLTYDELQAHINFLNQLWRKDVSIDSFENIEGLYYVVIAGHSRLLAIQEIGKRENCQCMTNVKIHPAHSSEDILAIQLDENIHSEPRIEERAIAIIETYRLGLMNGKWNDKNEFIRLNQHKFSRRVLGDALAFSDLPIEVQEFIFKYNIPYAVGVELGRAYPLIEKYEIDKLKDPENDEIDANQLTECMSLHYGILTMKLQKAGSVKKALATLSAHCTHLNDHFRDKEVLQQEMLEWFMSGAIRQSELHYQELLREYKKLWNAATDLPFTYFKSLAQLEGMLTGIDHSEDIREIGILQQQHVLKRLDIDNRKKKE